MLALLKLIPWKDVAYLAVILGLVGWLYHKGEAHVEAQDKKVAIAAQTQVNRVATAAQTTESQSAIIYKQAVVIPAVGDIGVECVRQPASSSQVPATAARATTAASQPAAVSGEGRSFDPSGALLTRAREADAQITYLQARIRELEAEMNGAP